MRLTGLFVGRFATAFAAAAALCAVPALAQKSADTLRSVYADPISTTLAYDDHKPETEMTSEAVFDNLVCYDRRRGDFTPNLASSWRQVDDRTIEMKLRAGVTFHDGSPLTAADVAYTLNWVVDPASKLRFAAIDLGWLDHVEAVDDATVRIVAKQPTPLAMIGLAVYAHIVPAKLHASFANKSDFGRKSPIGTGPYRVVSFDSSAGIVLAKNPAYVQASDCKPAGRIGTIRIAPMPDRQTQIAQLTVGGLDFMHAQTRDEPEMLAGNPALTTTALKNYGLSFLVMDVTNRSGNAALSNQKVRQAIGQAFDHQFVARSVMPGGDAVLAADALCTRDQLGCDVSRPPAPYDPAAAKRLLAEAGYPDGFDVEITALQGTFALADAVSGEFRKIGIRATVDKATFGTFRQKQAEGKNALVTQWWPTLSSLDASQLVSYLFDATPRNYTRDDTIAGLAEKGLATVDQTARKAIYRQLFDRVNELSFLIPIASFPDVVAHSRDLGIDPEPIHAIGLQYTDLHWN
jgi:peptide/nickel transport system substrate-binding protein